MAAVLVFILVGLLMNSLSLKIYAASVNRVLKEPAVEYNGNRDILDSLLFGIFSRQQVFSKQGKDFFVSMVVFFTAFSLLHWLVNEDIIIAAFHSVVLTALFMADAKHWLLPNIIVLPAAAIQLGILAIQGDYRLLIVHAAIAIGIFLVFYLIFIIATLLKKEMGGGDVKIMPFLALWLGPWILLALVIANVSALAFFIFKKTTHAPFGPFLVAGALVASLLL